MGIDSRIGYKLVLDCNFVEEFLDRLARSQSGMDLLLFNIAQPLDWLLEPLSESATALRRGVRVLFWHLFLLTAFPLGAWGQTGVGIKQEVRVVWGGTAAKAYQGSISIDRGSLRVVRNLSVQPSAAGSMVQTQKNIVEILAAPETTFRGADIAVDGLESSKLQVRLQDSTSGAVFEYQVALSELQQGIWLQPLGGQENRLAIERQSYDRLRVHDERPHSVFHCDEVWPLQVSGYRTGLSQGEYLLTASWVGRRSASPVITLPVSLDDSGSFDRIEASIKVPSTEGPHRLEWALIRPTIIQAWTNSKPLVSRSVELVAIDPSAEVPNVLEWKPLLAIDPVAAIKPSNLGWLISFASNPLASRSLELPDLTGLAEMSLGEQWNRLLPLYRPVSTYGQVVRSGKIGTRDFASSVSSQDTLPMQSQIQKCVTIDANGWLALPLSGLKPGQPHRVRIEVPTDRGTMLTVAVKDSADLDQSSISPQHTILAREGDYPPEQGSITQDIVFWPRSDSILLFLASGHRTRPASVGKILLESAVMDNATNGDMSAESPERQPSRNVGIYIDQPFLVECLAAPREKDPSTGSALETWATWQAVAERLVFHLQTTGTNTLVLNALNDGSSLFPLQSLQTVPWLDKSTFFTDGRSPQSHDFIELLLRHFERAGLRLVIELDLNFAPRMSRKLPEQAEQFQVDIRGQSPSLKNSQSFGSDSDFSGPQLNPLDPKVQAALAEVVGEVAQRYQRHAGFAGISLRLRGNSHLVFAGERFGYNAELLKQFASVNGVSLPAESERIAELFSGVARQNYLTWRAGQLTQFYSQLTRSVQQANPDAKLYVNTTRLWDRSVTDQGVIAPEVTVRNPQQYLLGFGLDMSGLSKIEGLVVTQGTARSAWESLSSEDWMRSMAAEQGAALPSTAIQAAFVTHLPSPRTLSPVSNESRLNDAKPFESIPSEIQPNDARSTDSGMQDLTRSDPGSRDSGNGELRNNIAGASEVRAVNLRSDRTRDDKPVHWKIYADSITHGKYARQVLVDQLARADQQCLAFGGWYPVWTQDSEVVDFLSTFRNLPPIVLTDLQTISGDAPVRIRHGTYSGKHYFVLINSSGYECTVTVKLGQNAQPSIEPLTDSSPGLDRVVASAGSISVVVPAFDVVAWIWKGEEPDISWVDCNYSAEVLGTISKQLEQLESRLASASDPAVQRVLFHGSGTFEQWVHPTKPTGWNVSSLPDTVIQQAMELPHSGNSSISIENNNKGQVSAWIQSSAIELPQTGRLTLRAWLRSSAADNRRPKVRVGVIGRLRNGQRYERSVFYGGADNATRPLANDWGRRPAELHIADIPVDDLIDLQIAIDLIGPGKIWVDDVEVLETWLHPDERNFLRGQLLVAKQRLQAENPFPAERILRSPWNSYLQDMDQAHAIVRTASNVPIDKNSERAPAWNQQKSTFQQWREGMIERWRR